MRSLYSAGFLQRHHLAFAAVWGPPSPRSRLPGSAAINSSVVSNSTAVARMATGRGDRRDPSSNPKVARLRELMASEAASAWEKSWEEGLIPWDLGQPTPVVQHLVQRGTLPTGRVLVPGCGSGYDVVAIASPERYVVGLEISHSAVKRAKEWSSSSPNASYFTFLVADFFTWQPTELFDLIFDYTFFCAIDPCMRADWARKVRDLLKPDGQLIALIYLSSSTSLPVFITFSMDQHNSMLKRLINGPSRLAMCC